MDAVWTTYSSALFDPLILRLCLLRDLPMQDPGRVAEVKAGHVGH